MAKTPDDLEAVRAVVSALNGFSPEEQERVIRWAREKLGLTAASRIDALPATPPASALPARPAEPEVLPAQTPGSGKDLKAFVARKSPKSDVQFAATVAYFYRFESPLEQRRNEIDPGILQDACRLAGRSRLKHPSMTLNNAKNLGVLDKGSESGKYVINSVGENLVAMTLPEEPYGAPKSNKRRAPSKRAARRKK